MSMVHVMVCGGLFHVTVCGGLLHVYGSCHGLWGTVTCVWFMSRSVEDCVTCVWFMSQFVHGCIVYDMFIVHVPVCRTVLCVACVYFKWCVGLYCVHISCHGV